MRQDRTPRTSASLSRSRPSGPTQQSRLIERAVPVAEPSGSGLSHLSDAFGSFFNIAAEQALDKSAEVAQAAKEKEVIRLQAQAQRDLASGEGPDGELLDHDAYQKTFYGLVGDGNGRKLAGELKAYTNDIPLEESVLDAGQAWITENYGNGTGNDIVDSITYKHLQDTLNEAVETRTTIRIANQTQTRLNTLASSIGEIVTSGEELDVEAFNAWVGVYQQANPTDAKAARARVMDMVLSSSNDNDAGLATVDRFLSTPGTGMNGKSFEQSFPDAYDTIQQKLINARRTTGTLKAVNAYSDIKTRVASATTVEDLVPLVNELNSTRQQYGEGSEFGKIQSDLTKKLGDLGKAIEVNSNLSAYISGQADITTLPFDKAMRDAIPGAVAEAGGAVLTDDVNARRAAASMHINLTKTADKTRDALASALGGVNETNRLQAYSFMIDYANMKAANGQPNYKEAADKFLFGNEDARALFLRVARADLVSDESISELFNQYLAAPSFDPAKVSLEAIEPRPSEAISTINSRITSHLSDQFGDEMLGFGGLDVEDIDPAVLQTLRSRFRFLWGRAGSQSSTWKDDLQAVTESSFSGLGVVVRDGRRVVTFTRPMRTQVTRNGEAQFREVKPLHIEAQHPQTGEVTDTVSEAESAVGSAAEALGFDSDEIGIESGSQTKGYYPIRLAGDDPLFELGSTTPLPDGSELTLPEEPEVALKVLQDRLGDVEGIDFEEVTLGGRTGLRMVYRPVWDSAIEIAQKRATEAAGIREFRADVLDRADEQNQAIVDLQLGRAGLIYGGQRPDIHGDNSLVDTEFKVRDRFMQMLNEQNRSEGRIAPSSGITTPEASSLEELSRLEETHIGRVGMRAASPTYAKNLYEFLKDSEGFRSRAYRDHKGFVTVGIGFNMDAVGARDRFKGALPEADFDEVYDGADRLTDNQVRRLFDNTIGEYENIIDSRVKDTPLTEHQRIALVSLAFNSPSLIGKNLSGFVKGGDIESAVKEILLRSNASKHKGLQNRRVAEAQMFAGNAFPISDTLIRSSYL